MRDGRLVFLDTEVDFSVTNLATTGDPASADIAQVDNIAIGTVADNTLYTATINGVACSFTSGVSATGSQIQAGLVAAINASSQAPVVTAANGAGTSVNVTSDVPGTGFTLAVTANLAFTATTANYTSQASEGLARLEIANTSTDIIRIYAGKAASSAELVAKIGPSSSRGIKTLISKGQKLYFKSTIGAVSSGRISIAGYN